MHDLIPILLVPLPSFIVTSTFPLFLSVVAESGLRWDCCLGGG